MSIVASFPQLFSLARGANYRTLVPFKGLSFNTMLSGFTPYRTLSDSNAIPGWSTSNLTGPVNFAIANSTQTFNSNLAFKSGANIANRDGLLLYPFVNIPYTVSGSPAICIGDWLFIAKAGAGPNDTGFFKLNNQEIELVLKAGVYGRSALYSQVNGAAHTNMTNQQGSFSAGTSQNYVFEWEGSIDQINALNSGNTFRFSVGAGRIHRANTDPEFAISYNPISGGPPLSLSGNGVWFIAFPNANKELFWYFLLIGSDVNSVIAVSNVVATNISAHSRTKLKIVWNGFQVQAYANNNLIATIPAINAVPGITLVELNNWCFECRELSTAAQGFISQANQSCRIYQMTLTPGVHENTTSTLDIKEESYHNTGLQLLKKLK